MSVVLIFVLFLASQITGQQDPTYAKEHTLAVDEYGEPQRAHNIYEQPPPLPVIQEPQQYQEPQSQYQDPQQQYQDHVNHLQQVQQQPQAQHQIILPGYEPQAAQNTPPPKYSYPSPSPQVQTPQYVQVGASQGYQLPHIDQSADSLLDPIRRVRDTNVSCQKNHMVVTFKFSAPFSGFIYPYEQFPQCILFRGQHSNEAVLTLHHGKCGQKQILNEENPDFTVTIEHRLMIQWERDFMCEDDASVIVRCERPDDFNKTIAWNFGTLDFASTLEVSKHPGPSMWMEIQLGEGPNALPLDDKPVFIGDTLTLVFTLSDNVFWFDSNILNCVAIAGNTATEQIEWGSPNSLTTYASGYTGQMTTVERGCSVKPKIFSHFYKEKITKDGYLVTLHYAHFKAFRLPTSLKIVLQCDVQVCYKECRALPPCSDAFQPRAAKIDRRKRSVPGAPDVKELETVELFKTIEVVSAEDAGRKDIPVQHSLALTLEEIELRKIQDLNCYSPSAFYSVTIVLGFSTLVLAIVLATCYIRPVLHHGK